MKAPDRIYVGLEDVGSGTVWNVSILDNGHPSFIRKDALLEWLNEKNHDYGYTVPFRIAIQSVIDKLNNF